MTKKIHSSLYYIKSKLAKTHSYCFLLELKYTKNVGISESLNGLPDRANQGKSWAFQNADTTLVKFTQLSNKKNVEAISVGEKVYNTTNECPRTKTSNKVVSKIKMCQGNRLDFKEEEVSRLKKAAR